MISAFSSSLSGMRAAFQMLDVSANNTANINTDGFKRQRLNLSEAASGGVTTAVETTTDPGAPYLSWDGTVVEGSNVDIAEEAVNQIIARRYLSANIAALKTADEMYESILDIIA